KGEPVPGHRTEIRSRFEETNRLWQWDVAETFIGSDFENIKHYYEFQVSPQGEWVDLDIHRDKPVADGGWQWNSGFEVKARLDEARKIWYGEMRSPLAKIDIRAPRAGNQNTGAAKKYIAWQPTGGSSYHVPESFGRLKIVK
ncbi:MAG: hypothetical protein ABIZ80_25745, partial [Bryobacteraceae bacterium]